MGKTLSKAIFARGWMCMFSLISCFTTAAFPAAWMSTVTNCIHFNVGKNCCTGDWLGETLSFTPLRALGARMSSVRIMFAFIIHFPQCDFPHFPLCSLVIFHYVIEWNCNISSTYAHPSPPCDLKLELPWKIVYSLYVCRTQLADINKMTWPLTLHR